MLYIHVSNVPAKISALHNPPYIFCTNIQATKISPVFQLQPNTVYFVNEFDNVAVFPHETSGCFNLSLIDPSAVMVRK